MPHWILLGCLVLVLPSAGAASAVDERLSRAAVAELSAAVEADGIAAVEFADGQQPAWFKTPLTAADARRAGELLWDTHARRIREARAAEIEAREVRFGEAAMPFFMKTFGEPGENGRRLFLSMHGGGGAPAEVNDQQWRNQQRLYEPEEGVYVAPRAPSNEWDLWHRAPVAELFDRLIESLVVLENVDPNRVYLMGYSAGGDGVYQLAPRMADRWAAAAMMAGHPNDASPLGLRNVGFILQMGGRDAAYKRNEVAAEWREKLAALRGADPGGYRHLVKIYAEKGHWMDREDAIAVPWMAEFTRNPLPDSVVWRQDDLTRRSLYWLGLGDAAPTPHSTARAKLDRERRSVEITTEQVAGVSVYLSDKMGPLDEPWTVTLDGERVFAGTPERTIATLAASLARRGDPELMFSAEVVCR